MWRYLNPALVSFVGLLLTLGVGLREGTPLTPNEAPAQPAPAKKAALGAEPPRDPALRFQLKHGCRLQGLDLEFVVKGVAFVPNQDRLLTLSTDTAIRSWDLKSGEQQYRIRLAPTGGRSVTENTTQYCSPLAVSSDGRFAAVCGLEASVSVVEVYNIREQKKIHEFKPTAQFGGAWSVAFSTRGDRLAVALQSWGALQWSLKDAKSLTQEKSAALPLNPKNDYWASAVTHLRGDNALAVGLLNRTVAFYDAQSGEEFGRLLITTQQERLQRYPPYQLALSNDGGLLLAVARGPDTSTDGIKPDNMITVWDTTTGEHAWTFTHKEFHVGQAALSPDGRYVAVGFLNDPTVRLYRLSDGNEMASFKGHTKGVTCIAFSPDGKRIASGSLDCTAIVWDVDDTLLAAAAAPKGDKDFARRWGTLRDGKPLEALEAVASLAAAKDDGVAWLEGKLAPVPKPDPAQVRKWLAQLADNDPDKRDAASRELAALGARVEAELKEALKSSSDAEVQRRLKDLLQDARPLWVRDRDTVRAVRGVYVLERVGSDRAVKLLKTLAEGDSAARLTREAKISLERLEVRKPPKP
jgi:WD40 repeat protein